MEVGLSLPGREEDPGRFSVLWKSLGSLPSLRPSMFELHLQRQGRDQYGGQQVSGGTFSLMRAKTVHISSWHFSWLQ